jgi:hypothetical protein
MYAEGIGDIVGERDYKYPADDAASGVRSGMEPRHQAEIRYYCGCGPETEPGKMAFKRFREFLEHYDMYYTF